MSSTIPSIDPTYVTMMCDAFVALEDVISDGELGALLISSGMTDVIHNASRHRRLLAAITNDQDRSRCADNLATFLRRTGFHIQKSKGTEALKRFRKEMNQVLTFAGYELDGECNLTKLDANKTSYVPPEADERAQKFKAAIKQRKMHPDIELVCRSENFVDLNYHRVVKEGMRLLMEKVKLKAACGGDGPELAERAFSFPWQGKPVLAINQFQSDADMGEQFGFMCMLKAFFLLFQDEQSRAFRAPWYINMDDALDMLALACYFHRKVDGSVKTQR